MGSVNISITEDVYETLKRLKRKDESFSEVIRNLAGEKDISRCYGLWKGDNAAVEFIRSEAVKARKAKWREVKL
ncbi:MAG TPA: antitoxin VapB family protein [Candidatus Bilamarchaeaceae archaeon]|nr:antitoxin VapB family protein [Candidatus Bilamarchaeaceae archaeon]